MLETVVTWLAAQDCHMRFGTAYDTVHFTTRVLILYHLGCCTFNTLFLFLLFILCPQVAISI